MSLRIQCPVWVEQEDWSGVLASVLIEKVPVYVTRDIGSRTELFVFPGDNHPFADVGENTTYHVPVTFMQAALSVDWLFCRKALKLPNAIGTPTACLNLEYASILFPVMPSSGH